MHGLARRFAAVYEIFWEYEVCPEHTAAFDRLYFSNRGWHSRYWRDWSSDVCSSDLLAVGLAEQRRGAELARLGQGHVQRADPVVGAHRGVGDVLDVDPLPRGERALPGEVQPQVARPVVEIGRASCRERV